MSICISLTYRCSQFDVDVWLSVGLDGLGRLLDNSQYDDETKRLTNRGGNLHLSSEQPVPKPMYNNNTSILLENVLVDKNGVWVCL